MSKWKKKDLSSFDNKLITGFCFISLFSLAVSVALSFGGMTTAITILLIAALFINLGIKHRIKHQWRWQGVKGKDLYKAIALVPIFIFMLANISVSLFYGMNRDNGRTEFNWQPDNHFNPFETISEAIKIFPKFISSPEHSFYLGLFCLMSSCIIFNLLVALKVTYLSEKEFIKDCQNPHVKADSSQRNSNDRRQSNSLINRIVNYFLSRPFILNKQQDTVKITFSKVTTYDLKANFGLILFLFVFFIAAIYGSVMMIAFGVPEYINNSDNPEQQISRLVAGSFQVIMFTGVAFFIWNPWLRAIFVRTVIEFNPEEITVWEQAFGSQRKILSIYQPDLLPLQEKQVNTQVPEVENASLRIRYRRRNIELAGHLLPKAMDAVRDTYYRYRSNSFNDFYAKTEITHLE